MTETAIHAKTESWMKAQLGIHEEDKVELVKLYGGISSEMYKLHLPVSKKEYVCRCVTDQDWLSYEPLLIEHEAMVLELIQEVNFQQVEVPYLIAYDAHAKATHAPALLMSKISGLNKLPVQPSKEWLIQLAKALVPLHVKSIESYSSLMSSFSYHYAPYHYSIKQPSFTWSQHPQLWEKLVEYCKQPFPYFEKRLIHRDFHPTNVLWDEDEHIVGVVDWINACIGPIGIDVGHCRINLVQMYGVEAAEQFLSAYANYNLSFKYDPYWDICCLLDMCMVDEIGVYDGWVQLGFTHLDENIVIERIDEYAALLVQKIS